MIYDLSTIPTLADVIQHNSADGGIKPMIDALKFNTRPLVSEGHWVRASENTVHEMLVATTRPEGATVAYNLGGPFVNPTETPKREQLMRIEANLKIDERLLDKSNDPVKLIENKRKAVFEGMLDTFSKHAMGSLFNSVQYGSNITNPLNIDGFLTRRNKLDATNCVGLGATGSTLSSIMVAKWGEEGVFFIHPKDGGRTLRQTDKTPNGTAQMVNDPNGNPYWVNITNWAWEFGVGVANDRCLQRICNIAASGTGSFFGDAANPYVGEDALIDAFQRLPGGNTDNVVIYVGPAMYAQMQKRIRRELSAFRVEDIWAKPVLTFMGVPVLRDEYMPSGSESTVS